MIDRFFRYFLDLKWNRGGVAVSFLDILMLAAIIVGAAIGAWLGSPLWKRGQARIYIRKA